PDRADGAETFFLRITTPAVGKGHGFGACPQFFHSAQRRVSAKDGRGRPSLHRAKTFKDGAMNLYLKKVGFFLTLFLLCSAAAVSSQMDGEAARDWSVIFRDTLQRSVLQF